LKLGFEGVGFSFLGKRGGKSQAPVFPDARTTAVEKRSFYTWGTKKRSETINGEKWGADGFIYPQGGKNNEVERGKEGRKLFF